MSKTYFPEIDILRFICAVSVVLFHLTYHTGTQKDLFWTGWIGVQVFFVISGFVIAQSAQDNDFKYFLKSRFLRLYPGAIVCALIGGASLLEIQNFALSGDLILSVINSILLFSPGPFVGGAYWTIPVEISFYFLISILVLKRKLHLIFQFSILIGLISAIYILFYSLQLLKYIDADWLEFGYGILNATLLRHGVYFTIGICLFQIHINGKNGTFRYIITIIFCIPAASLEIYARSIEIIDHISLPSINTNISWIYPIILFLISIIIIFISIHKTPWRLLRFSGFIRILGLTTYPLYLIHESIGYNIKWKIEAHLGVTGNIWTVLFSASFAIIVATLIAKYLEPAVRAQMKRLWESLEKRGSHRIPD